MRIRKIWGKRKFYYSCTVILLFVLYLLEVIIPLKISYSGNFLFLVTRTTFTHLWPIIQYVILHRELKKKKMNMSPDNANSVVRSFSLTISLAFGSLINFPRKQKKKEKKNNYGNVQYVLY